jgi:hypothetical protein
MAPHTDNFLRQPFSSMIQDVEYMECYLVLILLSSCSVSYKICIKLIYQSY